VKIKREKVRPAAQEMTSSTHKRTVRRHDSGDAPHPAIKIIVTLVYIVTVTSFDRRDFTPLAPYLFYPCILSALAEIKLSGLWKRASLALPFCFFAGISNIVFDTVPAFYLGGVSVSYGIVSFAALLLRTYLCVWAVLILADTTSVTSLCGQLRRFRVPDIFITVFEMTYRYIGVLAGEAGNMRTAYRLRGGNSKGILLRHAGSFVGSLFLRCALRAERVYAAMKCRGYGVRELPPCGRKFAPRDFIFAAAVTVPCVILRFAVILRV